MKVRTFEYDGRQFEVRTALVGQQHVVRVFENGAYANKVEYSVTLETALDAYPWDVVSELMDIAQKDFVRWSDWRKKQEA